MISHFLSIGSCHSNALYEKKISVEKNCCEHMLANAVMHVQFFLNKRFNKHIFVCSDRLIMGFLYLGFLFKL